MNRYVLYWWLIFCLQLVFVITSWKFGLLNQLFGIDITYITYLIAAVHVIATSLIGWSLWKKKEAFTDMLWYTAETQLSLGMIGTLIGFIIMLSSAFNNIAGGDISVVKASIAMIGIGMGIAIRATLLGLISGVLIKAQLLLLEKRIEVDTKETNDKESEIQAEAFRKHFGVDFGDHK